MTTTTSRPSSRRAVARTLASAAFGAVLLSGCQAVENATEQLDETAGLVQFCLAANDALQAANDQDLDAALAAGRDALSHAPDEVRPDVQIVVDAAERAAGGEREALNEPAVRDAADRVEAFARDRCDPR